MCDSINKIGTEDLLTDICKAQSIDEVWEKAKIAGGNNWRSNKTVSAAAQRQLLTIAYFGVRDKTFTH